MTRTKKKGKLYREVVSILKDYPNVHQMEVTEEWPYGLAYRILEGGYSPTLYKIIFPPRKRERLIINNCPPETVQRFKAQCLAGGVMPAQHVDNLMDLKDGVGEIV